MRCKLLPASLSLSPSPSLSGSTTQTKCHTQSACILAFVNFRAEEDEVQDAGEWETYGEEEKEAQGEAEVKQWRHRLHKPLLLTFLSFYLKCFLRKLRIEFKLNLPRLR